MWCWAGIATWVFRWTSCTSPVLLSSFPPAFFSWRPSLFSSDSSYSLLADDVLGSYLLCPHPKKPKCGSLIVRFPSGLVTHLVENTRKGKFLLEVNVLFLFQPFKFKFFLFSETLALQNSFFLFCYQKCKTEFDSIAQLIEHYTKVEDNLPCLLSCARVNHCYEWEEISNKHVSVKPRKSLTDKTKVKSALRKAWV